jgi:ligand-binding SRPBCC domain-containing protein
MHFSIRTKVNQAPPQVIAGFDVVLFKSLATPFPSLKVLLFEGCKAGDWVKIELNFIFFRQTWESLVTEDNESEAEIYFIDEGKKLPFFLRYWQHKHRVLSDAQGSQIIDDITYRSPFRFLDYVLFPMMYFQFYYRKPIYRRRFQ